MSKAYRENYDLIEWAPIKETPSLGLEAPSKPQGPYFVPDIKEFVAPGRVLIGSRSRLREYERSTGTRQCGELNKVSDYAPPPPRIDQRKIEEAAGKALQRVLG
jgi:hypothetical protein